MLTDKEAFKIAKELKNYCGGKKCVQCVFGGEDDKDECCVSVGVSPCYWEIPSRWDERDVNLAKALKAFGATDVSRIGGGPYWSDDEKMGPLPINAFAAAEDGETIEIEEIIREGAHK